MKITFINSAEIGDGPLAEWLLEADESKRREISLMRQADKRRLRIAADHLCRTAAAEALGLSPAEVKFGKNEHGKPITDGMEFNLSHSGDIAVCAVSGKPSALISRPCARYAPMRRSALRRQRSLNTSAAIRGGSLRYGL